MIFNKFQDHTAAIDVWAFGMILYCILFGKEPASYYKVYREWYMQSHGKDLEHQVLPFTPPSAKNFIYDPFSIDFDNPFENSEDYEELVNKQARSALKLEDYFSFGENERKADGTFDFQNFMKCIEDLSYSAMFASEENSKKFVFKPLAKKIAENDNADLLSMKPPRFSG